MLESWREPRFTIDSRCRIGVMGSVSFWLAVIFVVLAIIDEAIDVTLGLEPMSWYLLAIVAFLSSIAWYIGWAAVVCTH